MSVTTERHLPLQGSANFRDLGGYTAAGGRSIRWKRLFRSDALAHLTESDLATLGPIGVTTIVDLRSQSELDETGPSPLIVTQGARHRHLPFLSQSAAPTDYSQLPPLSDLYVQMLERGAPTIKAVFELLTDDQTYPAVVHCAAGKDRTGVTIALVLRTLGVADETIAADYALTEIAMRRIIDRLRASDQLDRLANIRPDMLTANAATMLGFLQTVDTRFGGADQVLADSGVPAGAKEQLRALLLE